ncbi:MAG TPA: ABC transporter substrate-binding protein [Acidimicrobiales bacterium]|nr:ABC transporter substrate-binding protein [Acidimicrobiales bacterium]
MSPRPGQFRRWRRASAALASLVVVVAACSPGGPSVEAIGARADDAVVVASFNFAESVVVAELYAQALEEVGVPVARQGQVGPREIMEPALEQGLVDLVPEYLGSALAYLDPRTAAMDLDVEAIRSRLEDILAGKDVAVLAHSPAQNQNGIVVTPATAARYGLSKVSDLAPVAGELVFAGPPECRDRPFCLPGLRETYGLEFQDFLPVDSGDRQTRAALSRGDADVGLLFTTDGHLAEGDFVLLADDRGLQPAENIVPLVRREVVARWGQTLVSRIDALTSTLTTDALSEMNAEVGIEGESPAEVAADWLDDHDLKGD